MGTNIWSAVEGTVCSASDVAMTSEQSWAKFRACRDGALEQFIDFFQSKPLLYDDLSTTQKNELKAYRQALLDLPATVLAAVGDNAVLTDVDNYFHAYAKQPTWFADKHPMGLIHT